MSEPKTKTMNNMKQYICKFSRLTKQTNNENCKCIVCSHNYPHKHTKDCDGFYCEESNVQFYDQDSIKKWLTCQPISNRKNTSIVKEELRKAKLSYTTKKEKHE